MRPGLSSYTYTWAVGVPGSMPGVPLSAAGLIGKAADSGWDLVQIADNLPLEKLPDEEITALAEYARGRKVDIEMGSRGLDPEHTLRCLDVAVLLDSPLLRMVIDSPGYTPDIKSVSDLVRDLVPELRSRGIQLAIENHDRFKARDFEYLINRAGSEWVGICLDSVNSLGAGEGFETVAELLVPYTINLHLKDFTIFRVPHKMGFVVEGRPAGQGMLDIPGLTGTLEATGKCKSAILELWTAPEASIDNTIRKEEQWAMESIDYLDRLFKEMKA